MTVLQIIGIIIGGLIGLYIIELAIVTFLPILSAPKQPLGKKKDVTQEATTQPPKSRKDVSFDVKGTKISAWLYLPENLSVPVPCIIMANGFGGTKDVLLERYAVRYCEAGYAALAFDYRHFGKSEGEPRQLMFISLQLEDYRAAFENSKVSDDLVDGVMAAVRRFRESGIVVFGFRPPTTIAMFELENELSGFNESDFAEKFRAAGGIWLRFRHGVYPTYDGSHLNAYVAVRFSKDLAEEL